MKVRCPIPACDLFAIAKGDKLEIFRQAQTGSLEVFCDVHKWQLLPAAEQRQIAEDLNHITKH